MLPAFAALGLIALSPPAPGVWRGAAALPRAFRHRAATPRLSDDHISHLERLYSAAAATERAEGQVSLGDHAARPGVIPDLPLLRIPSTALPGVRQCLLVEGPEWVHMFSTLTKGRTADGVVAANMPDEQQRVRYGHLTLPEDSATVALPEYATISGSQTPLVGVLMELREMRRLSDGRLLVISNAISRFRVVRATAASPYPRADVALLPDEEEVGLTGLRREAGLPTSALPRHWRAEAARAAAAAASLKWAEAEMAVEEMVASDMLDAAEAAAAATEQEDEGGRASAKDVAGRGRPFDGMARAGPRHGTSAEREELADFNLRLSIAGCTGDSTSAAVEAAEAALEGCASDDETRDESGCSEAAMGTGDEEMQSHEEEEEEVREMDPIAAALEKAAGRRIPQVAGLSQPTTAAAPTPTPKPPPPKVTLSRSWLVRDSPFLLALEQAMWCELHLCQQLASSISGEALPALPEQMLLLLPPAPRQGWPAGMPEAPSAAEWLQRGGYPPVRRAQRLSYLLGATLPSLLTMPSSESPMPLPSLPASLDRQALLQATSVRERLQRCVVFLCHYRQRLAALVALAHANGGDDGQASA